MKKLALALGIAGALCAAQASADPIFSLGGYTGAIKIKFSNWENFTPSTGNLPINPGSVNYGIVKITSIESDDGNNTPLWTSGKDGAELTGVFYDILVENVTAIPGAFNIQSSGGKLDVYLNPNGAFAAAGGANQGTSGYTDAGCAVSGTCYDGISNVAGGVLFLATEWVSGVDPTDSTITVDGDLQGSTFPGTGDAAGYQDVVGGKYKTNFDTNGQATAFGGRDLFLQNDFCTNGAVGCANPQQGNWQLVSEDPTRAFFVPEPGTLALLGLGLFGLGFGARRKPA